MCAKVVSKVELFDRLSRDGPPPGGLRPPKEGGGADSKSRQTAESYLMFLPIIYEKAQVRKFCLNLDWDLRNNSDTLTGLTVLHSVLTGAYAPNGESGGLVLQGSRGKLELSEG